MFQYSRKISGILLMIAILLGLLPSSIVYAAPPAPLDVTLYQPDGAAFQARAWGDEWSSGMETTDGYTILLDQPSLYWVYADLQTNNSLVPANGPQGKLIVGRDEPSGLPQHIRPQATRPAGSSASGFQPIPASSINTGSQKLLVLLVQFQNRLSVGTDAAYWSDKIFGSTASVKQYYQDVSYGQLSLTPAAENYDAVSDGVVGWLTLPYNHPNTGRNVSDPNRKITKDAILAAAPYINYASFDNNSDGYITNNSPLDQYSHQ